MMHTLNVLLLFCLLNFSSSISTPLSAQTILTVGLSKYTTQLRSIIETEGYFIENVGYKDISKATLQNKEALTLFNLRQTWDQEQIFSDTQVEAILAFVREGGTLYLTSRKGYNKLLNPLGVEVSGIDGNQTGREWPLILESITSFLQHPLTHQLSLIKTDVSGRFETNQEWIILGRNSKQIPLLAIRKWGLGKVVLGSGERIFRDPRQTSNRYETDISMGSNYQYHLNLFAYLSKDFLNSNTPAITNLNKEEIHVFPNPTTKIIHVQGNNIYSVEIIATNGQILKTITSPKENLQVDLSSYPKGVYSLRINTQHTLINKEIILL
jgi:hypothetical protein